MKYINHSSSNIVTKDAVAVRSTRLRELQAQLVAARELVKSNVGPSLYEVYDHKDNLVEWRSDTGWLDTLNK